MNIREGIYLCGRNKYLKKYVYLRKILSLSYRRIKTNNNTKGQYQSDSVKCQCCQTLFASVSVGSRCRASFLINLLFVFLIEFFDSIQFTKQNVPVNVVKNTIYREA